MTIETLNKDFGELKQELRGLRFDPLRCDEDAVMEGVVAAGERAKLHLCLKRFFGGAVSSLDGEPEAVTALIGRFGGLMSGQTLYCCRSGEKYICVMLWPWQDGEHTTVKAFWG
jgi:hypothetical protein